MQHLQDNQVQRSHRPQLPLPPDLPDVAAGAKHLLIRQVILQIIL